MSRRTRSTSGSDDSDGPRKSAVRLADAAIALSHKTRSVGPIDRAMAQLDAACSAEGHSRQSINALGLLWKNRYLVSHERGDLDRAIDTFDDAIRICPSGVDRAIARANLGNALRWRYLGWSAPLDLEEAIEAYEGALADLPRGHSARVVVIGALATALRIRGRTWLSAEDIIEAVRLLKQTLRSPACSGVRRASALNNLSAALIDRDGLGHRMSYLDDAVAAAEEALRLVGSGAPVVSLPISTNLAIALRRRNLRRPSVKDLERAASLSRENLRATPKAHPEWVARANTLGGLLRDVHLSRPDDSELLDQSIALFRKAIRRSRGSAAEPQLLYNLGISLRDRWRRSGESKDLRGAIEAWEAVRRLVDGRATTLPIDYRLGGIATWGQLGSNLIDAYLALADTGERRGVRRALAVAEGAKSRLLVESLSRDGLPRPADLPDHFVAQEAAALDELRMIDRQEFGNEGGPEVGPSDGLRRHDRISRRRDLAAELERAWSAIGATGPNGERYVGLRRAVLGSVGHLPVLASGKTALAFWIDESWTAIFVQKGRLLTVHRTSFGAAEWKRVLADLHAEVNGDRRTRRTWDLTLLEMLGPCREELAQADYVVVSPASYASSVPWPALIGDWREPGKSFPAVEIVPSLLARREYRARVASATPLIVGDPTAGPELAPLLHARQEALAIALLLGSSALTGRQATVAEVVRLLPSSSPIHFAAHAWFEPKAPLRSGVQLFDGVLTGETLLAGGLMPGLVTISGCHAGLSSSLAGEERMGLAQAALLAGATAAVVPLWQVDGRFAGPMMTDLYRLMASDMSPAQALARTMQDRAEEGVERRWWAPFQVFTLLDAGRPDSDGNVETARVSRSAAAARRSEPISAPK